MTALPRHQNGVEGGPGVVGVSISYAGPNVRKGSNPAVRSRSRERPDSALSRHSRAAARGSQMRRLRETAAGLACKVFSGHSACGTDNPTGSTWSLVPIAV
jgi:hypothetical protein